MSVCVYNSVLCVYVCECVCLFCTLDVFVCNPFLGVCVLTAFLAKLLILFHAFAETCFVLQSH